VVNIKAANIQKLSEFYRRPNHTSQPRLKVVMAIRNLFFATTTKLLSLFGSYVVKLIKLDKEHT